MMGSTGWDGQDHPMGGAHEDDFNQFLDMSGMGDPMPFDLGSFPDAAADGNGLMGQDHHHTATTTSTAMPSTAAPSQMTPVSAPNTDSISTIDAQIQYLQQQKFEQQQRQLQEQHNNAYFSGGPGQPHHHSVPPTPQSLEMPPGSGHFYTHPTSHDAYDYTDPGSGSTAGPYGHNGHHHRHASRHHHRHDMAFTPLVSPAVPAIDSHFGIDSAFSMPGGYFSPLTSPALHAQTDSASASVYDHSSNNDSPVAMDLEAPPAVTTPTTSAPAPTNSVAPVAATLELSKKARKNSAAAKSRSAGAGATTKGVRSSPISKPQRKKPGPSPAIVSHVLSEVDESGRHDSMQPLPPAAAPGAATTSSSESSIEENASVSPENLTDMPPPPVPSWTSNPRASNSPAIQPQTAGNAPATPASIMRLPASSPRSSSSNGSKSKRSRTAAGGGQTDQTATDKIESLELPEAVSGTPTGGATPRESPRILPAIGSAAASTPRAGSASQSPMLQPGRRSTPLLAPQGGRKRSTGGPGSAHASPALLPRISPNIKPLLPGGGANGSYHHQHNHSSGAASTDASQLLTSKSNYQNLIEGNLPPGVTYPRELSTNLTSKRTSHKLAEQGRRNRINTALTEMATLLPEDPPSKAAKERAKDKDGEKDEKEKEKEREKEKEKMASSATSKASVVEKGIHHIKHLTQENASLKKEIEKLKEQLGKAAVVSE